MNKKEYYKNNFLTKLKAKFPNLTVNTEYINSIAQLEFTCKIHNYTFLISPKNLFLTKYGCSKCAGKFHYNTENFIEKAKQVHNNKYDYSLVDYKNNKTKVKIICPMHGIFEQTPDNHINQK